MTWTPVRLEVPARTATVSPEVPVPVAARSATVHRRRRPPTTSQRARRNKAAEASAF